MTHSPVSRLAFAMVALVAAGCSEGAVTPDNQRVQIARIGFTAAAGAAHVAYTLTVVGFQ